MVEMSLHLIQLHISLHNACPQLMVSWILLQNKKDFGHILDFLKLRRRGTSGEQTGIFDISNSERIGKTEVSIFIKKHGLIYKFNNQTSLKY